MSDVDLAPRRREAGHFLRSRRERLSPAAVGLPPGARRRTPGLRREEVALLAGVGTTWYAWLEQGRDVRPSSTTLGALARALRLDEAERRHLFGLHGQPIGERAHPGSEKVGEALVRTLESLTGQPAYGLGVGISWPGTGPPTWSLGLTDRWRETSATPCTCSSPIQTTGAF